MGCLFNVNDAKAMMINSMQLTMSHTGLGDLNEYALMVLFGNAHSFRLVHDIDITPNQIVSIDGVTLYPAYFWTHLKVPLCDLLPNFKLWEFIDVGVDVKKFGETLLESSYVLGHKGTIISGTDVNDAKKNPVMLGNNLIVAEDLNASTSRRSVLNPMSGKISELPKVTRSPQAIAKSRSIRSSGVRTMLESIRFESQEPFVYEVIEGRDCHHGHAMIFAKFSELLDMAELNYLSKNIYPGISKALISRLNVIDREIYYFGNCYAGEDLEIYLVGDIEINQDDEVQDDIDFIPAAFLHEGFEVYQRSTRTLIASSITKKVFAIPMHEQENIHDLHRIANAL